MFEPALTASELEVMTVLWGAPRPLSKTEILERTIHQSFKDRSIHSILNSLMDKGYIEVDGLMRTTKNFARTFSYKVSRTEYDRQQFGLHINQMSPKSIPYLMSALLDCANDETLIYELETMLTEKKAQLAQEEAEKRQ